MGAFRSKHNINVGGSTHHNAEHNFKIDQNTLENISCIQNSALKNYKNFIDMLDNMAITKSDLYGIAEIKSIEKNVYQEKIK